MEHLKLAINLGIRNFHIELDVQVVANLLTMQNVPNLLLKSFISDCRNLPIQLPRRIITHILLGKANKFHFIFCVLHHRNKPTSLPCSSRPILYISFSFTRSWTRKFYMSKLLDSYGNRWLKMVIVAIPGSPSCILSIKFNHKIPMSFWEYKSAWQDIKYKPLQDKHITSIWKHRRRRPSQYNWWLLWHDGIWKRMTWSHMWSPKNKLNSLPHKCFTGAEICSCRNQTISIQKTIEMHVMRPLRLS